MVGLLWLKANTTRWFDLGSAKKGWNPPYKRGRYWMSNNQGQVESCLVGCCLFGSCLASCRLGWTSPLWKLPCELLPRLDVASLKVASFEVARVEHSLCPPTGRPLITLPWAPSHTQVLQLGHARLRFWELASSISESADPHARDRCLSILPGYKHLGPLNAFGLDPHSC